ncbi:MAG TPA: biotin carboxylase N-terminal domain-containing protein [Jatrophihabitans sp.]|nr:biotin carboxylase N-terminal domain-containing protein [Jatrophihabitans sp.]
MINSVLVANRGEIARRVFRTCRALGLGTVAVFSDPDAASPHVREADAAVRLPGAAPAETYLHAESIIDAARRAGADAVHPGYGFLSENAAFARAVLAAGLSWIGPPPDAIDAMGSKIEAKRLMADAGVPVLRELNPAQVTAADLPVLIKASAGGGGRGMRVVRDLADLADEVAAAATEAAGAFGNPIVFCEPYLATGRHIEVQVMADQHGTVWAVGERECSIQRRHQKVIEEAPSPLVERVDGMRKELFEAARAAAEAIGYAGAGTVEFLADSDPGGGHFYFLEMNTRLQVEHPVTECTTGLDLVALQIAVANGAQLEPEPPVTRGYAIEARLYAEDPRADWQPQSGTLSRFAVPGVDVAFGVTGAPAGVRLDSGVVDGTLVGIHYDPMLAKLITWAPTRTQAATALAATLARSEIHGVTTNRDLLVNVLRHEAFLRGETDTAFFERHGIDGLAASQAKPAEVQLSALAGAMASDRADNLGRAVLRNIPSGWRNVVSQSHRIAFDDTEIAYRYTRDGLRADGFDDVALVSAAPHHVVLDVAGVRRSFDVHIEGEDVYVDSSLGSIALHRTPRFVDPAEHVAAGSLLAPMPGSVVRIAVEVGQRVAAGEPILWLEAMKMQHRINAPADGVVTELPVSAGQQIDVGAVLAVVGEGT